MQTVDLRTGHGLDAAVTAQSWAEGATKHADVVRELARALLESDVVRRASEREHWRESYVGMLQEDGTVLEGFVDLIYREDDGSLAIVDYKTDDVPAEAWADRAKFYAPQLAAYARVLHLATGGDVQTALATAVGTIRLVTESPGQTPSRD